LPADQFLHALRREMRRSERSHAALSLVIYRPQVQEHAELCKQELLELLCSSKRETDIAGDVGDTIAVLCPDTDEQGRMGFTGKIGAQVADLPFTTVAATYPDDVFTSVAESAAAAPSTARPFQPFVHWDVERVRSGYPAKRCLDIVGSLIAIVLLAPLMLLVAAGIALTSRGPVIYKQTRLGRGGVPFTFYKFRSMVADVDDGIHREYVSGVIRGTAQAPGAADGVPYKLQADPRVTRIGRLIRRTSIDEVPQFFNVLKGDMSLVGPRPPIPYETQHYQAWHLRRILTMKPGITGVWQVEGRSKVPFDEMVRMDLRYIRECSLALDLSILLRTVIVVVRCEGAT
jgi:lipopolysaccharide/colanic/teichoic acid biosynthesis glycosyltransferase